MKGRTGRRGPNSSGQFSVKRSVASASYQAFEKFFMVQILPNKDRSEKRESFAAKQLRRISPETAFDASRKIGNASLLLEPEPSFRLSPFRPLIRAKADEDPPQ